VFPENGKPVLIRFKMKQKVYLNASACAKMRSNEFSSGFPLLENRTERNDEP
jgi:hypothetical protein